MKLQFIPLGNLAVSKTNLRWGKKAPDVSDTLPSVRKRGVIQPILVRPNCAPDGFEIVAGARRFATSALHVKNEIVGKGRSLHEAASITLPPRCLSRRSSRHRSLA